MQDPVLIYLHGFASSPHSGKASYLGRRARERGWTFLTPDLNLPDFSTLTVTRMLEQTRRLLVDAPQPAVLIGSSLGGYVAVNAAARWPQQVRALVLLAPALDFSDRGLSGPGGANLDDWERAGMLNVFHFAYGRMMPVHYELYADARRYNAMDAVLPMPVVIFQGRRDTVVSAATVEAWSARRPNVTLHLLEDDHQLGQSMELIWDRVEQLITST